MANNHTMEQDHQPQDLIVIGGGAAGFFGAIAYGQHHPQGRVTILEAAPRFLIKVGISGGGRCNVTHHCFDPAQLVHHYPRGGRELRGAFSRFQPQDTIAWFKRHGVTLKTEDDGRMFPTTDDSQTIIDCLMATAKNAGISLRAKSRVQSVEKQGHYFAVTLGSGERLTSKKLLVATGSNPAGYGFAQSLGHGLIPLLPSLFTFKIRDRPLQALAGVSVADVRLELVTGKKGKQKNLGQRGTLLITHWGLSGPAILKLSAWGARTLGENQYQLPLKINWLPDETPDSLQRLWQEKKERQPRKTLGSFSPFLFPKRLWQYLLVQAQVHWDKPWAEVSKKELNRLGEVLLQSRYAIAGKGEFKEEFVVCGGIPLKEVDFQTMESKRCGGLYFAGEILDIDGVTGGFNLQNSWTTGYLAGRAIAHSCTQD